MSSILRLFPATGYRLALLSNDDSEAHVAGAQLTEIAR
jgi:hypothetical protein